MWIKFLNRSSRSPAEALTIDERTNTDSLEESTMKLRTSLTIGREDNIAKLCPCFGFVCLGFSFKYLFRCPLTDDSDLVRSLKRNSPVIALRNISRYLQTEREAVERLTYLLAVEESLENKKPGFGNKQSYIYLLSTQLSSVLPRRENHSKL